MSHIYVKRRREAGIREAGRREAGHHKLPSTAISRGQIEVKNLTQSMRN